MGLTPECTVVGCLRWNVPIVEEDSWTWAGVFNITGLRYLGALNLTASNDRYQARPVPNECGTSSEGHRLSRRAPARRIRRAQVSKGRLRGQVRFKYIGNSINIMMNPGIIRGENGELTVESNTLSFEFDALHNAGTSGFFQVCVHCVSLREGNTVTDFVLSDHCIYWHVEAAH
jgi:hypothetical protein